MKISSFNLSIIICVILISTQIVFMIIPLNAVQLYNSVLRPLVYIVIGMAVYFFIGLDERPIRKSYDSFLVAFLSVIMLSVTLFITAILFGAGSNANLSSIISNLWLHGLIVILGEYIRYKLIKRSNQNRRALIIILLTTTLAFGNMNALRILIDGNAIILNIFFELIFIQLIISAMASLFAIEGNFLSVSLISFVYIMTPYLLPIMPNVSSIVFSMIVSGLAFITIIIYIYITNDNKQAIKNREKRITKYLIKRPILNNTIAVSVICIIIAFFAGLFPIYPLVVLTDSMAGTFSRGSVVFLERVPQNEAFIRINEGDVIHFISQNRVQYIHRIVYFTYDVSGERQYITRGDANDSNDPHPVAQENVLGISRSFIPFFGYPYIFFRNIFIRFNY